MINNFRRKLRTFVIILMYGMRRSAVHYVSIAYFREHTNAHVRHSGDLKFNMLVLRTFVNIVLHTNTHVRHSGDLQFIMLVLRTFVSILILMYDITAICSSLC
jgi:sarcosine oxidase gamma subunit